VRTESPPDVVTRARSSHNRSVIAAEGRRRGSGRSSNAVINAGTIEANRRRHAVGEHGAGTEKAAEESTSQLDHDDHGSNRSRSGHQVSLWSGDHAAAMPVPPTACFPAQLSSFAISHVLGGGPVRQRERLDEDRAVLQPSQSLKTSWSFLYENAKT